MPKDWKKKYFVAAELVADLYEAVTHNKGGPKLGVIEDVQACVAEWEAAVIEVGQLKQKLWPMKDAEIAKWKDAYENMRDFAVKSGLDITSYGPQGRGNELLRSSKRTKRGAVRGDKAERMGK